jgi:hypothetical protein
MSTLEGARETERGQWNRATSTAAAATCPRLPMSLGSLYPAKLHEQRAPALPSHQRSANERAVAESKLMEMCISDVWLSAHDRRNVRMRLDAPTLPRIGSPPVTTTELLLFGNNAASIAQRVPWLTSNSLRALQASIRRRRLDVEKCGTCPILFTAPHTINLLNPRGTVSAAQRLGRIVRSIAKVCEGAYITWTDVEVRRVQALAEPDRSNRK